MTDLKPAEIKQIAIDKGSAFLTTTVKRNLISFSGDTPVDDFSKWDGTDILIHEATFLKEETNSTIETRYNKHATISEVLKMVKEIKLNKLILTHFSSRYSNEEISSTVKRLLKELKIKIPVYIVYPGEIHRDILNTKALNE